MDSSYDSSRPKVVVVDDDRGIADVIATYLGKHGFAVRVAYDAPELDGLLAQERPDAVILDLMLPGEDGLSICRRLTSGGGPPVIMLSALGEETDRIVGLEIGADDYLSKPCNPRELLARLRAVLRRGDSRPVANVGASVRFDNWTLDLIKRELQGPGGQVTALTAAEFGVLRAFLERPGKVLSRDTLLDLAHGPDTEVYDRTIDVIISRLRRKLHGGSGAEVIQTVRSEGYRFTSAVES